MSMETNQRIIGVSVCVAIVGVGLVVTGFASDHWVACDLTSSTGNVTGNSSEANKKSYSKRVSLGLFNGEGAYDVGLGSAGRYSKFDLHCDLSESICGFIKSSENLGMKLEQHLNGTKGLEELGLFKFPMFATSLVMLCFSMAFGLLAIGFSFFNIFGKPIETITGITGLYVWNAMALMFTLIGIGVYMGLFFSQLADATKNLLLTINDTTWIDDTTFDWSFYCVVGAAGAYFINIFLLVLSGKEFMCSYLKSAEKKIDEGIILY